MDFALQLFGGFRLARQGGLPPGLTERARALLAYLAVAAAPVPRQVLAGMLSNGGVEREQRTALRQALYLVRKATSETFVVSAANDDLLLNGQLVQADVQLFRTEISSHDRSSLTRAVDLYRGDFLDGIKSPSPAFEEWLQARRAGFLDEALAALLQLAAFDAAEGLHDSALAYARRALALDPLREDAHRQVMACLAALGRRTSALRQYATIRHLLAEELGVSPEASTTALHDAIANGKNAEPVISQPAGHDGGRTERPAGWIRVPASVAPLFKGRLVALLMIFPLITAGVAAWYIQPPLSSDLSPHASDLPSLAILPFAKATGDGIADVSFDRELTMLLSTHPAIRVVSPGRAPINSAADAQKRYTAVKARYVLEGSIHKPPGRFEVMVQLIDSATGDHIWADRLQDEGDDIDALQEHVAYRIYESLVGFSGAISRHEQQQAWRKPVASLKDKDYVWRGQQLALQFTKDAHAKWRQVLQEGLARFPESSALRLNLAASYRYAVEAGWSKQPDEDLAMAWQLAEQASLAAYGSRYDEWASHWMLAKLAQWCQKDFERSVTEATRALKLLPYDATSRADLAELMANAGKTDEAIDWLLESIKRDPQGPEWYRGNLAWAYYLAGRHEQALDELQKLNKPRPLLLAAVYIRLRRFDEARAVLRSFRTSNPAYTIIDAARWPLQASLEHAWLQDLREAGLPEN
jgi:DNA-binding SARP family transcriptional activator/TolB-like protein